uniref:Uncharacterized protein n=1 Tax=Timema tahoe TaxID=61484 RepID=A0A7R9IEK2_9NEOP|nr:unnamed protein product [Timema tahoe]
MKAATIITKGQLCDALLPDWSPLVRQSWSRPIHKYRGEKHIREKEPGWRRSYRHLEEERDREGNTGGIHVVFVRELVNCDVRRSKVLSSTGVLRAGMEAGPCCVLRAPPGHELEDDQIVPDPPGDCWPVEKGGPWGPNSFLDTWIQMQSIVSWKAVSVHKFCLASTVLESCSPAEGSITGQESGTPAKGSIKKQVPDRSLAVLEKDQVLDSSRAVLQKDQVLDSSLALLQLRNKYRTGVRQSYRRIKYRTVFWQSYLQKDQVPDRSLSSSRAEEGERGLLEEHWLAGNLQGVTGGTLADCESSGGYYSNTGYLGIFRGLLEEHWLAGNLQGVTGQYWLAGNLQGVTGQYWLAGNLQGVTGGTLASWESSGGYWTILASWESSGGYWRNTG